MSFTARPRLGAVLGTTMLLMFAACGSTAPGSAPLSPGGSHTVPIGTPQRTPQVPGSSALNGCPVQSAPASASTKPVDVILTDTNGAIAAQPTSVNVGQTLEVRLAASVRWALSLQDPQHVVTSAESEGWYDAAQQLCIWRFTAATPGSAALVYAGGLVCAPGSQCPTIAKAEEFDITVQ